MKRILVVVIVPFLFLSFSFQELSEMAILMRKMLTFLKVEKEKIAINDPAQAYPTEFLAIKSAKVTEGKDLSENHKLMLDSFFVSLNTYYQTSTPLDRKIVFNNMINKCLTCHEQECPGPIPAIKKQKAP
jgi:hypothetical protein